MHIYIYIHIHITICIQLLVIYKYIFNPESGLISRSADPSRTSRGPQASRNQQVPSGHESSNSQQSPTSQIKSLKIINSWLAGPLHTASEKFRNVYQQGPPARESQSPSYSLRSQPRTDCGWAPRTAPHPCPTPRWRPSVRSATWPLRPVGCGGWTGRGLVGC